MMAHLVLELGFNGRWFFLVLLLSSRAGSVMLDTWLVAGGKRLMCLKSSSTEYGCTMYDGAFKTFRHSLSVFYSSN